MSWVEVGSREYFEDMNRFIGEHRITPVVEREFTFDEALQAFAHMAEQRRFGKLVINLRRSRRRQRLRCDSWLPRFMLGVLSDQ
jgi:hypothetical protein